MLTTVKLLGALGDEFIQEIRLCVNSVHEAMWALCNIYPSFRPWVLEQGQHGLAYEVFVGDWQIEERHLDVATGGATVTIVPIIQGSGGGLGKVILGLALVGIGVFSGGAGFLGLSSTSLIVAGSALLIGGLIGALQPKAEEDGKENSLIFGSTTAVTKVGAAKPLAFGVHLVNPVVVSARIRTFSMA